MSTSYRLTYRPYCCGWELTRTHLDEAGPELSLDECLDVVSDLARLGCRFLTLQGEPFRKEGWDLVAQKAAAQGIVVSVVSVVSGAITRRLAHRIKGSGVERVLLPLDNVLQAAGARAAADALDACGVTADFFTRLDRDNLSAIEEIHDLALDLGASSFQVRLRRPRAGSGAERACFLDPDDLVDLLPRIAWLKQTSPIQVDVGDSIGYYGPYERQIRKSASGGVRSMWSGCQAGRTMVGIRSDGVVTGCLSLWSGRRGNDGLEEGSLRSQSLEQIWFDEGAFSYNRNQKVSDLTGACRFCRHASVCRGGAKCVSLAFASSLTENPFCFHGICEERIRKARGRLARNDEIAALLGTEEALADLEGTGSCEPSSRNHELDVMPPVSDSLPSVCLDGDPRPSSACGLPSSLL